MGYCILIQNFMQRLSNEPTFRCGDEVVKRLWYEFVFILVKYLFFDMSLSTSFVLSRTGSRGNAIKSQFILFYSCSQF